MNFVLVGFSDQNAEVLSFFIKKTYPEIKCTVLARCFAEDLRLVLPKLTAEQSLASAFIVNLDGVGMTSYAAATTTKKELVDFLGDKPAILLSRGDIKQWQAARIWSGRMLYQKIPYNQNDMNLLLAQLIENINKSPRETALPVMNGLSGKTGAYSVKDTAQYATQHTAKDTLITNNTGKELAVQDSILPKLMQRYFGTVYQNSLLRDLVSVFLNTEPFRLIAGTQEIFIHPKRNIAMGRNVGRFLDYCAVAGSSRVLLHSISVEIITEAKFQALEANLVNSTYRRHSLNTLLWQVYSAVLPATVVVDDHPLKFKARFMPNFGGMQGVPDFVHAIVATCLVMPRSIEELQVAFPELADRKEQLQRIFIVAILSGVADMEVLETSVKTQEAIQRRQQSNEVVAQAVKTGFFKRLLNKLTSPI